MLYSLSSVSNYFLDLAILPFTIFVASCFILLILYYLIKYVCLKKLLKECMLGNYEYVIKNATRLYKIYYLIFKIFPVITMRANVEFLSKILSISYLATEDEQNFLKHINFIEKESNFKELWLSLYYLLKDDIENAIQHYELLKGLSYDPTWIDFLDCIYLAKQGEKDEAQKKFSLVYPKLNYAFTKQIADMFMQS